MYNFMLSVARFFTLVYEEGKKYTRSGNDFIEDPKGKYTYQDGSMVSTAESGLESVGTELVTKIMSIMGIVMPIVFSIVTVLGVAYSVVLGINYAKAEDSEKREEAKKRLTGAVIGFGIAIVLSALIWGLSQVEGIWTGLFG